MYSYNNSLLICGSCTKAETQTNSVKWQDDKKGTGNDMVEHGRGAILFRYCPGTYIDRIIKVYPISGLRFEPGTHQNMQQEW
jgi:hypothetical protein